MRCRYCDKDGCDVIICTSCQRRLDDQRRKFHADVIGSGVAFGDIVSLYDFNISLPNAASGVIRHFIYRGQCGNSWEHEFMRIDEPETCIILNGVFCRFVDVVSRVSEVE